MLYSTTASFSCWHYLSPHWFTYQQNSTTLVNGAHNFTSSSFYICNSSVGPTWQKEVYLFNTSRKNTYPQWYQHNGFSLNWLFYFGNLGQKWTNSGWMLQTFLSKRWDSLHTHIWYDGLTSSCTSCSVKVWVFIEAFNIQDRLWYSSNNKK